MHFVDVHGLPDADLHDADDHLGDLALLLAPDGNHLDDVFFGDHDVDPVDLAVTDLDDDAAVVDRLVNELADVLGLDVRWELAYCRCSGFLHDDLLDVDVVETILLCKMLALDGSVIDLDAILEKVANDDATLDVLFVGYPILDASHDVDANLLDAILLHLLHSSSHSSSSPSHSCQ